MATGGGMELTSVSQIKAVSLSGSGATYSLGNSSYKMVIGVYNYNPDNFASRIVVGNDTDGYKAPDLYMASPSSSTGECGVWFDVPANSYFKSVSGGWTFIADLLN